MIVENINTNGRSDKHAILAYAQTISNYFIEALDQNDCNVKVVVGFYQELDDTIDSILDLDKAFQKPTIPDKDRPYTPPLDINDIIEKPLESDFITAAAVEALKERCFDCNLKLPKINFSNDLDFLHNKLSFQLDVYKATFDNPLKGNYCHLAAAMQYTCIPDIVKLLGMILTAYTAVLALNKLPTFSLNAFIKGIVGTLIAKVVGSISISLDASSTGLPCLLGVLEELAFKMPTLENVSQRMLEDQLENWVQDYQTIEELKAILDPQLADNWITAQEYEAILAKHRKEFDPINYYAEQLESEVGKAQDAVSGIFEYVNGILGSAQDDINSYISAVLGVINFFECENKRSGPDFSEIMEYLQNLTTVINIFSALIAIIVPKTIFWHLCKDEKSYKEIIEVLGKPVVREPLTKTELEEILTEFTQNKTEISEDGLSILIYDKPVTPKLPKLELLGCNFKDFAEAHSLENIVKNSIDDYMKSEESKRQDSSPEYETSDPFDRGDFDYEYSNNNRGYRDPVDNTTINKFTPSQIVDSTLGQLFKPITTPGLGSTLIETIKKKDSKELQDLIDKNFKDHGYVKEDLIFGDKVFNDQYVNADRIYDHIFNQNNSNLINGATPNYSGSVGGLKPVLEFTQNSRDYIFGSTVIDINNYKPKGPTTSKEETVEYEVLERVPIAIEDFLGKDNDFSNVLDGILDFIYNDPNSGEKEDKENRFDPADDYEDIFGNSSIGKSDIEDILQNGIKDTEGSKDSTKDRDILDKDSIDPIVNYEEELSIYTKKPNTSSSIKSIPTGAECRSIEDVMNVLKNINI